MAHLFEPGALQRLGVVVRSAPSPPVLHLRLGAPSAFAERLATAAHELVEGTGGALVLQTEHSQDLESVQVLEVAGREAIHYRAVPQGPEAPPFVEAVLAAAGGQPLPGAPVQRPTWIQVFIAPTCPNCPEAVRAATSLAIADPLITVEVIDVDEHVARAEEAHVQSVPTTMVDDGLTVVGVIAARELAQRVADANGVRGRRTVLASQLEAGRFAAASRLLADDEGRRALAELWLASTLGSRIGLLLAVEEALERDASSLDPVAEELLPGLQSVDVALRGDTVDLLGRIGNPVALRDLELLLRDPVADIAEAAREAVAILRGGGADHGRESGDGDG